MRLTQGTFSYLPPLSAEQIAAQVHYAIAHGWSVSIEHTDDPHPRNVYWQLWGLPMFDLTDPAPVLEALATCQQAYPDHYIRISAYDARLGRQTTALSFITARPAREPRLRLVRPAGPTGAAHYVVEPPLAAQERPFAPAAFPTPSSG